MKSNQTTKFFIAGLGSMGKRRIRNLLQLGYTKIRGFDLNEDRRRECEKKYRIKTDASFEEGVEKFQPDSIIISVSPDAHHIYMKKALDLNKHFFVEASVTDTGLNEIIKHKNINKVIAAPSGTLFFHPAIQLIRKLLSQKKLGKISNVTYHSGQYLPDWHTYEKVSDFYVSNKNTGGAREIVPFELTWLTKLFGFPHKVCGIHKKTINIPGAKNIDDTYNVLLDYPGFIMNLVVDVVSRKSTRKLLINGDKKQLTWNWDNNYIEIYHPETRKRERINYEQRPSAKGYDKNITEQMYVDEMMNFINATRGKELFFNSLEYDHRVLRLLYMIERSYRTLKFEKTSE